MELTTKRSSLFNRPLYLAAILLTSSVVLRIVVQADQAVALVQTKEVPLPTTTTVQSKTCEDTFDVEPVLTALNSRSARLDEKEAKLLELENTAEQAKIDAEARLAALKPATSDSITLEIAQMAELSFAVPIVLPVEISFCVCARPELILFKFCRATIADVFVRILDMYFSYLVG